MALSVSYARQLAGLSFGVTGKFIQSKILDSAQAMAMDFGALTPTFFGDTLRLSMTVTNLGTKMKFEEKAEDLPMAIRFGSAFRLSDQWSAGSVPPASTMPATQRCNRPTWPSRSATCQSGHDGTGASNPFRLSPAQALTADQGHNESPEESAYNNGRMDGFPAFVGTAGPPPTGNGPSGCCASDSLMRNSSASL